ncbi:MAG: NADPH:quinone reductase-like Zn-dependent oxidoreductase [Gammaproteobacteria bacterium]|jgi:NADPH:quinone reductase-like Zn-dependent oxidoreductase
MRAWEIMSDQDVAGLALNEHPDPSPGPGQVLVRMRASALNYRDLSTIESAPAPGLTLTDGPELRRRR